LTVKWIEPKSGKKMVMRAVTYFRSPSTSGRSFVIAMTSANSVTKDVMNATGALQIANQKLSKYIYSRLWGAPTVPLSL